jgi:hypothetical protein
MRNVLLGVFSALLLFQAGTSSAQQILTQSGKDSAVTNFSGGSSVTIYNRLKSATSTPVFIRWNVVNHNVGTVPGWELSSAAGICDNNLCRSAQTPDDPFVSRKSFKSFAYDNGSFGDEKNDFHVIIGTNNPANGTSAFVQVNMLDTVSQTSRVLTFVAMKTPTGVNSFNTSDEIVLYPNPAREAVNVIYDPTAGVKTIAVYNLIGKLVGPVYRPTANGSAKINTEDLPTGMYLLRLMDTNGHVVATRRFTRQ